MMKHSPLHITYFFRHPSGGFSIAKVSRIFVDAFRRQADVYEYTLPYHVTGFSAIARNLLFAFCHRSRHGINHLTGDCHFLMLAFLGTRSVLTIHDTVLVDTQTSVLRRFIFKWLYYRLPLRVASRVVCISEHTRRSVLRFTSRKDVLVIPDAVDGQRFRYDARTFRSDCPRLLFVGTGWNKNVARSIRAVKGLSCELLILGRMTDEIRQALDETKAAYRSFENLSDEEVYQLYCACDVVMFCSVYEGFGMPVIEGNAVGRPVITSNIQPLSDVASDAACLVDNPEDEAQIRAAVVRVVSDDDYRGQLVANGLRNVCRFLPETVVEQYADVYNSLYQ